MKLEDLEVYELAREISKDAWEIYQKMNHQTKRTMGGQFISAADSIGANISEGFGRYHYLDKNKFNYNARGSLFESLYWLDLLLERKIITAKEAEPLKINLQNFQSNLTISSPLPKTKSNELITIYYNLLPSCYYHLLLLFPSPFASKF